MEHWNGRKTTQKDYILCMEHQDGGKERWSEYISYIEHWMGRKTTQIYFFPGTSSGRKDDMNRLYFL